MVEPAPALPVPRKSLFQSLGLRKKSFQSLKEPGSRDSGRSASPATPAIGTPLIESPAAPRGFFPSDGFPFPTSMAKPPIPLSQADDGSSNSLSRSLPATEFGHKKQTPSIGSQISSSTKASLNQRSSIASLRAEANRKSVSTTGHNSSLSGTDYATSPPPSPKKEKTNTTLAPVTTRRRSRSASGARNDAIVPPLPPLSHSRATSAAGTETVLATPPGQADNVVVTGRRKISTAADGVPEVRSSRFSAARFGRKQLSPPLDQVGFKVEEQEDGISELSDQLQSASKTLESQTRSSQLAIGPPQGLDEVIAMSIESTSLTPPLSVDDATPRATTDEAFPPLGGSVFNQDVKGGEASNRKERRSRSSVKRAKLRRLAASSQGLPHYPSLTDAGQLWIQEHPGQVLDGAHGPRLLAAATGMTRSMGQSSNLGGNNRNDRDDSSRRTAGGSGEDGSGRSNGDLPSGGSGGRRDDDDNFDGYGSPDAGEDEDQTSSSEESEDDYGVDENSTRPNGGDTDDSDDVPLGQRVGNLDTLQERLKASSSVRATTDNSRRAELAKKSRRTDPSKACAGPVDSGELSARLQQMQLRQESRAHSRTLRDGNGSSAAYPMARPGSSSTAASTQPAIGMNAEAVARAEKVRRARSLANRVRPTVTASSTSNGSASNEVVPTSRPRRSSDAGQKSCSFAVPPLHTMPSANQTRALQASLPVTTSASVSQAALVVATQAAQQGKIPMSAIAAQAQTLAMQATQATQRQSQDSSSGVTAVPLGEQRYSRRSSRPSTSSAAVNESQSGGNTTADEALITRSATASRRPAPIDTRVGLLPPLKAPDTGSSAVSARSRRAESISSSGSHQRQGSSAQRSTAVSSKDTAASQPMSRDRSLSVRSDASAEASTRANVNSVAIATASKLQRYVVYIITKQRYTQCELAADARARDLVLNVLDREGLYAVAGRGGWVVFEVSSALGIERPVREYELLADVMSKLANPSVDFLLLKQTELSTHCSIRNVPAVSPTLAGWVYLRDHRNKWSKRWLELRDHSLFCSKSEKGKDERFLCPLTSFDVYLVDSQMVETPKTYAFAMKMYGPQQIPQDGTEYVYYFSLSDALAYRDWLRATMNARAYCMRQRDPTLFQMPPAPAPSAQSISSTTAMSPPSSTLTSPIRSTPQQATSLGERLLVQRPLQQQQQQQGPLLRSLSTKAKSPPLGPLHTENNPTSPTSLSSPLGPAPAPLISREALSNEPFGKGSLLAREVMRSREGQGGSSGREDGTAAATTSSMERKLRRVRDAVKK